MACTVTSSSSDKPDEFWEFSGVLGHKQIRLSGWPVPSQSSCSRYVLLGWELHGTALRQRAGAAEARLVAAPPKWLGPFALLAETRNLIPQAPKSNNPQAIGMPFTDYFSEATTHLHNGMFVHTAACRARWTGMQS